MSQGTGSGVKHNFIEVLSAIANFEKNMHRERRAIAVVSTWARTRYKGAVLQRAPAFSQHRASHATRVSRQRVSRLYPAVLAHITDCRYGSPALSQIY